MSKRLKINRKDNKIHILVMGLNDSEISFLQDYSTEHSWELSISQSDMDGWDHADHEKYDICIIGPGEDNQDMDYLAWLLKDVMKPSQLIIVTSNCSKQDLKHFRKYHVRYILQRPLDPDQFSQTIEKALIYQKPWYVRLIQFLK